ncbi:MAG: endonuclease III [Alphaproteobacteria bacterium]|nr:endonuclease III [Alphaproteobacteria bacterium]
MTPSERLAEAYRLWQQATPEPKSDLEYTNAYTLLVAVVLSAQATDAGVNKATRALFEQVATPAEMLDFGEERLMAAISTIGLFRSKTKYVIGLSQQLIDNHGGEVPCDQKALEALPGVGHKTANVVMNIIFGAPTIAVDTHIFRIGNRTGMAVGKTVDAVEKALVAQTPAAYISHAHHWLILHGRYTCVARKPKCGSCVIRHLCDYEEKIL